MTINDLINLLKSYDKNTIVITPSGSFFSILEKEEVQIKKLYPDLTEVDNSINNSGTKESYLLISKNQFC